MSGLSGVSFADFKQRCGIGRSVSDSEPFGLIKAVDKFDCSYEVCFSTYAVPMIAGEIKPGICEMTGILKVTVL